MALSPERCHILFALADTDGDGRLSMQEIAQLFDIIFFPTQIDPQPNDAGIGYQGLGPVLDATPGVTVDLEQFTIAMNLWVANIRNQINIAGPDTFFYLTFNDALTGQRATANPFQVGQRLHNAIHDLDFEAPEPAEAPPPPPGPAGPPPPPPEQDNCVICQEPLLNNVEMIRCGHSFHGVCLDNMRNSGMALKCPLCRQQFVGGKSFKKSSKKTKKKRKKRKKKTKRRKSIGRGKKKKRRKTRKRKKRGGLGAAGFMGEQSCGKLKADPFFDDCCDLEKAELRVALAALEQNSQRIQNELNQLRQQQQQQQQPQEKVNWNVF